MKSVIYTLIVIVFLGLLPTEGEAQCLKFRKKKQRLVLVDPLPDGTCKKRAVNLKDVISTVQGEIGTQGEQGPVGPEGPAGPTGPQGPSEVRSATTSTENLETCNDSTLVDCPDVLGLNLEDGNWLVQSTFWLENNGAAATTVYCGLASAGEIYSLARPTLESNGQPGQGEIVALSAVFPNVLDGTEVAVRCTEFDGRSLTMLDVTLTALKVGTVVSP